MLQFYYDRYFTEDATSGFSDKMNTADIDFQHSFVIKPWQTVVWGAGYRYVKDDVFSASPLVGILPGQKRLDLFQGFIQDEIWIADSLRLTVGTKLLHNVYTGLEWQPSARIAWTKPRSTLWAAVSRAVRTPSRIDVDYFLPTTPQPPTTPSVAGGPDFVSEKLVAYELGYRFQPNTLSSFSISGFYNTYDDIYSVEALPNTLTYQIQNGSAAETWGAEFSGNYQVMHNWRIRGGYTFFKKDIYAKPGHQFNPEYLGNDARSQAMLQSILDLPFNLQLDITARYLDELPATFATIAVPAYATFDARIAYTYKGLELAVAGQNLGDKYHTEFGANLMPRHVYAKISARF
jgi:iron complex outermembrane receptor protein